MKVTFQPNHKDYERHSDDQTLGESRDRVSCHTTRFQEDFLLTNMSRVKINDIKIIIFRSVYCYFYRPPITCM